MKLSLIICSRNRAQKLVKCLASISGEEMIQANGELILVNNNSTDDTQAVMNSFKEKASFPVQVLFEPREGHSHARNAGLLHATGDTIAFTDDDCCLTKDYLLKASTIFDAGDFDFCGGQIWLPDKTDAKVTYLYFSKQTKFRPRRFIAVGKIQGANMLFSRRLVQKTGLFDTMLGLGTPFVCEDIDYAARASWLGFWGAQVPELIIHHYHGRKTREEVIKTVHGYDRGRGAYYMKFILAGHIHYLGHWFLRTFCFPRTTIRGIKAAAQYYRLRKAKPTGEAG